MSAVLNLDLFKKYVPTSVRVVCAGADTATVIDQLQRAGYKCWTHDNWRFADQAEARDLSELNAAHALQDEPEVPKFGALVLVDALSTILTRTSARLYLHVVRRQLLPGSIVYCTELLSRLPSHCTGYGTLTEGGNEILPVPRLWLQELFSSFREVEYVERIDAAVQQNAPVSAITYVAQFVALGNTDMASSAVLPAHATAVHATASKAPRRGGRPSTDSSFDA
jgi:hypothetical protein